MQSAPHQQPFVAHPLVHLAAAFASGILGAHFLSASIIPRLILCLVASLLALTALIKQRPRAASSFLAIAFLFAGAGLASIEKQSVKPDRLKELIDRGTLAVGEPVELTGAMERQPESAPASFYLTLRVGQLRTKGGERSASGVVTLLLPVSGKTIAEDYERLELRYGARLRVMTVLNRADNYRNPGVSKLTEYLERKGYDATGVIKSPLLIERLDDEPVFLPLAWLYEWRQQLEREIISHFSPQTAGVLLASLLGNRHFLSQATAERFREGGTFHVLVISGLHISFIGGVVFLLARRITRKRVWQFLLATTVLWSYALAVGAETAVVRAALMFTLIAFAPVVSRRGASLNSLGASALALLVWRPSDLFDPAFQLTFLSVLAIVVFGWPLLQRISQIGSWRPTRETPYPPSSSSWLRSVSESLFWSERNWKHEMARLNYSYKLVKTPLAGTLERYHLQRPLRYAFAATVVSLSVQLTLLPLLVVYFHRVSVSSLILNIIVGVLIAMLAVTAAAALIIAQVSTALAAPLISLTNVLNWLMVHSVDPFARFGIASCRVPEYSGWAVTVYVLYCVPLVLLALSLHGWNPVAPPALAKVRRKLELVKGAALAQVIALAVIVAHPLSAGRADGRLHVNFLDVGQGDAALVTMPDGTTLLVDGGGRPKFLNRNRAPEADDKEPFARDARSVGEAVVSEYLWWRGLDRVDYILATHADADHIDGLNDVVRNFAVGVALVARRPRDDPEYATFDENLRARAIPVNVISTGDVLRFGGIMATVHWPMPGTDSNSPSENNDSVVLQLQFGGRTILLTGDVEKEGEAAILSAKNDLRSDIVKVPHHGSRTSSIEGFVAAAKPAFAIISAGQRSVFGHPHSEVVDRWRANGAAVLTTGKSGMITVTTNGWDLNVKRYAED